MKQLPNEFTTRMKELLGEEYPAFQQSLGEPPVKGVRLNGKKGDLKALTETLWGGPIPYAKNGYYDPLEKIGNHPYHHAGVLYVQDPAAMMPPCTIELPPNAVVLDLCAAPGGKSFGLYSGLGEDGILVSNEIIPSRCKILVGNIERLGFQNTVVTCMDSAGIAKVFPKTFDVIMVDAPCSGEGMFRKEDIAIDEWSTENVETCAARQREILENARVSLKDGGTIVYATCTYSVEENEATVQAFLNNHPEFQLVEVGDTVKEYTENGALNLPQCRRFYPHVARGEGQFAAVLKDTTPSSPITPASSKKKKPAPVKIPTVVTDFMKENLEGYRPEYLQMRNDTPIYFPPRFSTQGAKVFACGVTVGEIKKNYIQPHHQLFSALGHLFKRKINFTPTDPLLLKYLKGEEIPVSCENGWAVITVDGFALGGVKVVNGVAKNHYPKGLRLS